MPQVRWGRVRELLGEFGESACDTCPTDCTQMKLDVIVQVAGTGRVRVRGSTGAAPAEALPSPALPRIAQLPQHDGARRFVETYVWMSTPLFGWVRTAISTDRRHQVRPPPSAKGRRAVPVTYRMLRAIPGARAAEHLRPGLASGQHDPREGARPTCSG